MSLNYKPGYVPGSRAFESPEQLAKMVGEYLDDTNTPTMAGLCLHLGFTRETWSAYSRGDRDTDTQTFGPVCEMAKLAITEHVEAALLYAEKGSGAGRIFWLKNHAGYKDQQQFEVAGQFKFSDEPMSEEDWNKQFGSDSE